MREDPFVDEALAAASGILAEPLSMRRAAPLLNQVIVNNELGLTIDPKSPTRGQSAFQTYLCVYEPASEKVEIPRVVMEFKSTLTTNDVLTYSTKARKHMQVYSYLRGQ
jgi:hypothetical protein